MHAKSRTMAPVNTLSLREAAAKYDIPPSTISGWVRGGMVRIVARPKLRGQPMLIAEPDVAALAETYERGRGHWNTRNVADAVARSA